jgi:hypothetical protein
MYSLTSTSPRWGSVSLSSSTWLSIVPSFCWASVLTRAYKTALLIRFHSFQNRGKESNRGLAALSWFDNREISPRPKALLPPSKMAYTIEAFSNHDMNNVGFHEREEMQTAHALSEKVHRPTVFFVSHAWHWNDEYRQLCKWVKAYVNSKT